MAKELNGVANNSRGFYLRVRRIRRTDKPCFYKLLKWVLCFSLSCCFIATFMVNHSPHSPKSNLYLSKSVSRSRALFESVDNNVFKHPLTPQGSVKKLKIYIYNLPPKYNTDWLSNSRCGTHLFASEVAIHKALLNSDVRTFEPREADFFYVPVYVSCNFSSVNGFPAIGHTRALLSSAIDRISSELPFWNRSHGSDHVFVASHDFGPCFHNMEDVAIADGIPEFLRNSVILQTFGVDYPHPCQAAENVVIPPYVSIDAVRAALAKLPANGNRDIFAFFRGKMEIHPKNISGRFYSKRVRTAIWRRYGNDRRFYLKRYRYAGYQSEIARSVFCLCPLGWAPWSPRLVESVVLGCVPVIIADNIRLPFPSAVDWSAISLTVAENDIGKLGWVLDHVAATNLTIIQRNLRDPAVSRALLFSDNMEEGDATWQVLSALSQKLERSHRVTRVVTSW